jgi:WD40 repeat protein
VAKKPRGASRLPEHCYTPGACARADNAVRLWDVATRQEVAELRGHGAYVHAVAFGPDGRRLVSSSGDCTVRVWKTIALDERARGPAPAGGR